LRNPANKQTNNADENIISLTGVIIYPNMITLYHGVPAVSV